METKTWNIDTTHSGINLSVRHMVVTKVRGRFTSWTGKVALDTQDLTRASVEVEIDANSIDTGLVDRDDHLRSPDFLDAQRFPKLSFRSVKVEKSSAERYRVHGELTIRDVTRPVTLDMEYGGEAKDPWGNVRAGFTASTSINRTDFGLKWNQALEAGGLLVGERVDIELEIEAVQAAASQAA